MTQLTADFKKRFNAFIDDTMNNNDLPGISIGVSIGSESFIGERGFCTGDGCSGFSAAFIMRDPGSAVCDSCHVFHCASVSKLFTSTAIMMLVEEGVLNLADKLCDILPKLRIADRRYENIKLWNLLTHTSGLADVNDYHWGAGITDDGALKNYIYNSDEVLNQPLLWAPQEVPEFSSNDSDTAPNKFRYSNIAFEILGQIISEKSGMLYEDFIRKYLFDPCNMTASTMKTFERRDADMMAAPYYKTESRNIMPVEHYPYNRAHAPSSTLTSTVSDFLKWGRAHIAGFRKSANLLLQEDTYDKIRQHYATVPNNGEGMGLGWFMRQQQDYALYGHEGTDDGFRASFWICPELEVTTVVLSNLSGAPVKKLNKKLFSLICEELA